MLLLLAACADPEPPECDPGEPHVLLATTDYEAGALAAVALDGSCVADPLATSGPDPLVRWVGDRAAVADRSGGNAVRLYRPGAYGAPDVEFAADRGANVHDVARAGDALFVTQYDSDELLVADLRGRELARVDLADHADADGIPEADRIVVAGGTPLVALNRLDRDRGYAPAGDGRILALDPDTFAITSATDAGPDPKIFAGPTGVLVLTGVFHVPDGALHAFDGALGPPIVREADLGYDLSGVAGIGEDVVVLGLGYDVDDDAITVEDDGARIDCVHLPDGTVTPGLETLAWPVDLVAGPDAVYVAMRTGWAEEAADSVLRVDPATCTIEELASGFTLDPFGLALVPAP